MRALRIVEGPARLELADLAVPAIGPRQALVRVCAAGVNRADVLQARGKYPPPPGAPEDIPGLEFAGLVEATGAHCSRVSTGQRVVGLTAGGAHAEFVACDERLLLATPPALDDVNAAAVPEAYVTAHDALVTQAAMRRGERVLVHAAASGVGVAAVQIALWAGCVPFGTTRSTWKVERLRSLFCGTATSPEVAASNFMTPDGFDDAILQATGGEGADIILDPVGAAYFERDMRALARLGRLVVIATMGGATAPLPLQVLMRKRLRLIGTVLRTRASEEKAAALDAFARDIMPKLASRELAPVVDRTFTLDRAAEAYSYVEEGRSFGKVVLTMTAR